MTNTHALSAPRSVLREQRQSALSRFFSWADAQQESRFIWLGVALTSHASLFTPLTVMAILLTSNSFPLLMVALGAMGLALVTNLAALPTKITIPAFFLSIIIDITVLLLTIFVL